MTVSKTTRLALPRWSEQTDPLSRAQLDDAMASLESQALMFAPAGPLADRPAAAKVGRIYRATDATGGAPNFYWDTGTAWIPFGAELSGSSFVGTMLQYAANGSSALPTAQSGGIATLMSVGVPVKAGNTALAVDMTVDVTASANTGTGVAVFSLKSNATFSAAQGQIIWQTDRGGRQTMSRMMYLTINATVRQQGVWTLELIGQRQGTGMDFSAGGSQTTLTVQRVLPD